MKKNLLWFFGLMLVAGTISFSSCTEDLCKDVVCGPGTCFDGTCVCDQGFEGTNCETAWNVKYVGNFNTSETCVGSTAVDTYSNTIAVGADALTLSVSNFGDSGAFATLAITESGKVTVNPATINVGGNLTDITGDGTITGTILTVHYVGKVGGVVSFDCTATMTKQ